MFAADISSVLAKRLARKNLSICPVLCTVGHKTLTQIAALFIE